MDSWTSILTFVFWFLTGVVCSYFAYQRGRDPYFWFAIGLFFGLLGLLVLVFLPAVDSEEESNKEVSDKSVSTTLSAIPFTPKNDYIIKDWFYIDQSGQQHGPISFDALKTEWREGKLNLQSFIWTDTMPNWKRVEEVNVMKSALEGEEEK